MKKLISALVLITLVGALYAVPLYSGRVPCSEYGPRTSATLNTILTAVGASPRHLVLNAGQWNITNNVTIPTNIILEIERGSSFWVDTGATLTMNGYLIDPGPYAIFSGAGTVTGTPKVVVMRDSWGSTSLQTWANDGDFRITGTYYGTFAITNLSLDSLYVSGAITCGTLVVTGTATVAGSPVVTEDTIGGIISTSVAVSGQSIIDGCYVQFVDTNNVEVETGAGVCYDTAFVITSTIPLAVDAYAGVATCSYVYVDYDASTFPSTISVYDSTTVPTKTLDPYGWYCSTSTQDRCLGAFITQTNPTSYVLNYTNHHGRSHYVVGNNTNGIQLLDNGNPDGDYQAPTVSSAVFLPVNATRALIYVDNDNAGRADTTVSAVRKEVAVTFPTGTIFPPEGDIFCRSFFPGASGWVVVGPSREIYAAGDFYANSKLDMNLLGFEIER